MPIQARPRGDRFIQVTMEVSPEVSRAQRRLERERRRALHPRVVEPEPAVPLDAEPARTHEATRAALAGYGRRCLGRLALGIVLALAVFLLARADPRRYADLVSHGTQTAGVVESSHQNGRKLALFFHRIRVTYRSGAVPHATTVWLDPNARRYRPGTYVPIVYRTDRPAVATVVGEWNVAWWRRFAVWIGGAFAVLAIASALGMAWGLWRSWRALRRRPWVTSEYSLWIGRRHIPTSIALDDAATSDGFSMFTVSATPRRLDPLRSRPPSRVWVATAGPGRPVAFATPGAAHLYMVRRYRGWRRWLPARFRVE
jgi:hypothetical protein